MRLERSSVSALMPAPSVPTSQPWHERGVNHIRHTLSTDRSNGKVDILEGEPVRRDELQRKTLGRELLECQLARLVAVTTRAGHGDELHREPADGEVRKVRHLALCNDPAAFALERLDA